MIDDLIASDSYKNEIDVNFCTEQKDTLVQMLNIVNEMTDKSCLPDNLLNTSTVVEAHGSMTMVPTTKVNESPVPKIVRFRSLKPKLRVIKGDLTEQKVGAIVNTVGEDNS